MKKVFQEKNNDCMQASIASIMDLELKEVPPFIEFGDNWFDELLKFFDKKGFEFQGTVYNPNDEEPGEDTEGATGMYLIKECKGIDDLFLATVRSPRYWKSRKGGHMVICDKNFNIVFDPQPEYQNIEKYPDSDILGYNGITNIMLIENK